MGQRHRDVIEELEILFGKYSGSGGGVPFRIAGGCVRLDSRKPDPISDPKCYFHGLT